MRDAAANIAVLRDTEVMKRLANILRINVAAAATIGSAFSTQLGRIYLDALNVYRVYSEAISAEVSTGNLHATKTIQVKLMRSVKQEVLRLIETFVEHSQQQETRAVAQNFVPPLLQTVLPDYAASAPDARDAQVLSVLAAVITRLLWVMSPEVPRIFAHVFAPTLEMITRNFTDYPDHRLQFFELIRAVNASCFESFFQLTQEQFKLVMDSIVWAFKHTERNVASTGLTILLDMLTNVAAHPDISDAFYVSYYRAILSDIFYVLTDTFHKPEFKQQAAVLKHLFMVVETGQVKQPLWNASTGPVPNPPTNQ
jgi:exportin-1